MAKGKFEYWLTDEGLLQLGAWARNGLTDEQIAKNMGVGYSTLKAWKTKYQAIQDALKKNKAVVDAEVENALFKKATGFTGPDGKYYPPDTTAQIFWLKNRKPEEWREKREHLNDDSDGESAAEFISALGKAVKDVWKEEKD